MIHFIIYIRILCTYKLGIETQTGRYNTMAKTAYFATDANGKTHTRNSDRVYTHTVVYRNSKERFLASANAEMWADRDGWTYDYYAACAAGTHPHVTKITPAGGFHHSYTAEQIAERQEKQRQQNASEIADAKTKVNGVTREQWIAARLAERVAVVEATDFTVWHNAGWCGRLDLAQKLAAKYNDVAILPAVAR